MVSNPYQFIDGDRFSVSIVHKYGCDTTHNSSYQKSFGALVRDCAQFCTFTIHSHAGLYREAYGGLLESDDRYHSNVDWIPSVRPILCSHPSAVSLRTIAEPTSPL